MTGFFMAMTCLLLLGAAPATRTGQRMIITHVQSGIVYWHGHRLTPRYEIAVTFMRTASDTMLENIYINDLPVFLGTKTLPERHRTNAEIDTVEHKETLFARAGGSRACCTVEGGEWPRASPGMGRGTAPGSGICRFRVH